MDDIRFAIEGQAAIEAAEDLLGLPEFSGTWEAPGDHQKGMTLAAIATIAGLVGGTLSAAEQIRKWYQSWKKGKRDKKIDKVVIVGAEGKRLELEGASVEEIRAVLEDLNK